MPVLRPWLKTFSIEPVFALQTQLQGHFFEAALQRDTAAGMPQ